MSKYTWQIGLECCYAISSDRSLQERLRFCQIDFLKLVPGNTSEGDWKVVSIFRDLLDRRESLSTEDQVLLSRKILTDFWANVQDGGQLEASEELKSLHARAMNHHGVAPD